MGNFIREYLQRGLIEVGNNDDRLVTLNEAAESLSKVFADDLPLMARFIRATLVPSVDVESPVLGNISHRIEESWATFVGNGPERKTPMLVAVGWQAVFTCANENPDHLALVWYASADSLARGTVDEFVLPIVDSVQAFGEIVEKRACQEWRCTIDKPTKQVRSIAVPEAKNVLSKALLTATTGVGADGAALENGNSNPIDSTSAWGAHFAKQASHAITMAINSQQKVAIQGVQESFSDLSNKFKVIRDEAVRSHQAQNARTELLWLAESAYSPRFGCCFGDFKGKEAVAALAVEIAEIASGAAPLSVEHFLAAQSRKFVTGGEVKIDSFVKELSKAELLPSLPESLITPLDAGSSLGLFEAAGELNRQSLKSTQVSERIGYPKTKAMPASDLARILFHEIKCAEFMGVKLWT